MQPATDLFLAAVRQSHIVAAACRLVFPDGQTADVPVETGQVTIDRTARHRRTGNLQIPWSLQVGADLGVDLRTLPLGGYAIVSRGIRYADGSVELIPLGRLRVESVTWDTLAASAALELADRMAQVADEPFTAPYAAVGKAPAVVAAEIIHAVFGDDAAQVDGHGSEACGSVLGVQHGSPKVGPGNVQEPGDVSGHRQVRGSQAVVR